MLRFTAYEVKNTIKYIVVHLVVIKTAAFIFFIFMTFN